MAEPAPERKTLADELRKIRSLAGISGRRMAEHLGKRQATVSRIEQGQTLPTRDQVLTWLTECDADNAVRVHVLELLDAAHGAAPTWSRRLAGRSHLQGEVAERERGSAVVRNFQPTIVPGLLQTAEYARQVTPLVDRLGIIDVDEHVAARLDRQADLHKDDRRYEFLLGERTLRWAPGEGVMAAQLDRLASVATLAAVEIAVLPESVATVPWHNFVLHQPADDSPVYVTAELMHGPIVVRDPGDVAVYVELWEQLWSAALTGDAAVERIRREQ